MVWSRKARKLLSNKKTVDLKIFKNYRFNISGMKQKLGCRASVLAMAIISCISVSVAQQPCRVSKIIFPEGRIYDFRYDTLSRLQTITVSAEKYVDSFLYYKDSVVIVTTINDIPDSRIVYTFNKEGFVTHKKKEPYQYCGWMEDIDYGYENGKLMQIKIAGRLQSEPPSKATVSTDKYTWQKGNLVKVRHFENGKYFGALSMQYDTEKPFRTGDYQSYEQIMSGLPILKPANLLKAIIGPVTLKLSYEWDANGNIISMTEEEENNTRVTKYEYECK
jgi:hypothetical protein